MLPETDATGSEMDAAPTVPADGDLAAELSGLPGVTKVCRRTTFSEDQYLLYYEMPIDHSDPSKGTFTQRLYLYYKGKDAPNMFEAGGYNLYYGMYNKSITATLSKPNTGSTDYLLRKDLRIRKRITGNT